MSFESKATLVPTSGMSFEKSRLIIRTYVVLSKHGQEPVHYLEVARRARVSRTQVSGANSFFVGLGFLTEVETGKYLPTAEVVSCLTNNTTSEMGTLAPVIRESLLFDFVKGQIEIHGTLKREQLILDLLEESNTSTRARAERAVEWLEATDVISADQEDKVTIKISS